MLIGSFFLTCRSALTKRGPALPALCLRGFHATALQSADVTVTVPSMGDSISEGTVASLEKKPGACQHISVSPVFCACMQPASGFPQVETSPH